MINCSVCHQKKASERCHKIELTKDERKSLEDQGFRAESHFWYCKPCWRLLNSSHAEQFMLNLMEGQLRRSGVPNVQTKRLVEKYKAGLEETKKNATKSR